jgi:outer membrane protein assembly factor BamB
MIGRGLSLQELARVLVPRGVAMLGGWTSAKGAVEHAKAELQNIGIKDVRVVELDGSWLRFAKPRPVEMDEWTHLNHNAGGNRVSQDQLAGPPSRARWIDGPTWTTAAKGPAAAVTSAGRLFYLFDEAPHRKPQESWATLFARDAFNGLLLWKRPAPGFVPLCLIATKERVYTVLEKKGSLVSLDAATGQTVATFHKGSYPEWAVCSKDRIFMSAGGRYSKQLQCYDVATGDLRWQRDVRLRPTGGLPNLVIDGEQAFYFNWQQGKLGCLDLATGKDLWQADVSKILTGTKWTYGLCSHQKGTLVVGEGTRGRQIHAFSDDDGKHLWSHGYQLVLSGRGQRHKGSTYDEGFFVDGLYWTHVGKPRTVGGGGLAWEGLDPVTGKVKKRYQYSADATVGDACHRAQATVNYFLGGHSKFVNTQTGEFCQRAGGIHNSCRYGMLPANGLVTTWSQYTTSYVRGVFGLTSNSTERDRSDSATRLEKGPRYGEVKPGRPSDAPGKHDWPCFRHDPMRSGKTDAQVPVDDLSLLWEASIGGRLTAPTVSNKIVYVAQPDSFRVIALSASSGEILWSRTLGGRVSTPPTLHKGLCLIGCGDGWVYCLAAGDGKLIWRFHAAPNDRLIVARDCLESPWPVTGGVLIANGLAFFAAGRDGSLDGGIATYAVEPFTGDVVWSKRVIAAPVLRLTMCDGRSLSLGGKTGLATKTGKSASRINAPEAAFAPDLLDLTHRIGANSDERRVQAQTTVHPVAIVRTADITFIAGRPGSDAPSLRWVNQRNSTVIADMPSPRHSAKRTHVLWAFSSTDGRLVATQQLDAVPVFDSLVATECGLFLSTQDGRVMCFGESSQ